MTVQIELLVLESNIWNHLTVCKQMSYSSFKDKVTNKLFVYKSHTHTHTHTHTYIYIYIYMTRNSDLGRRCPGGGRVLCREYVPSRHMRSKWSHNSPWFVNSASLICVMNRWPSGRVSASAYCGCWFDLQWWRSRCALLVRPNKVETAVQCSVCHM